LALASRVGFLRAGAVPAPRVIPWLCFARYVEDRTVLGRVQELRSLRELAR
jgi:hypothetical protein